MLVWKMYVLLQDTPCAGGRPSPQTTGRLLPVFPNVAEHLAIMALRKHILSFIGLYPDCDVTKADQSENFLRFSVLSKVMRNRGCLWLLIPREVTGG
jgi:hypothetical protein